MEIIYSYDIIKRKTVQCDIKFSQNPFVGFIIMIPLLQNMCKLMYNIVKI